MGYSSGEKKEHLLYEESTFSARKVDQGEMQST